MMSEEIKNPEFSSKSAGARKPVDEAVQMQIGKKLRQQYNTVVEEQIPDRFLDLLDLLDRAAGEDKSSQKQSK